MSAPAGDLLLVAPSLAEDGGGIAHLDRVYAASLARYAAARGRRLRIVQLSGSAPPETAGLPPVVTCGGSKGALVRAVLGSRPGFILFGHVGLARVEAAIPRWLRPGYGILLYGIDAWRPFTGTRRRAAAGARLLVGISADTRRRALEASPWLPSVRVLHPAIEEGPASGEEDRRLLEEVGEGPILIVGRMSRSERYKGHDALLEALAQAPAAERGMLVVVGGGDDAGRLAGRARSLGLGEAVRFTGAVSPATLDALYGRALALALPSRDEGFGLVYLEAMRRGKPCIGLRGSAADEVIEHEVTGLLVEPGDTAALAGALARLRARPELAARLGAAGLRRWQERFSLARFEQRLFEMMDEVLRPCAGSMAS